MGIMRIWCKVDNTKASPDNKVPCAIQDIKQGEMFGFFDFYCSGLILLSSLSLITSRQPLHKHIKGP